MNREELSERAVKARKFRKRGRSNLTTLLQCIDKQNDQAKQQIEKLKARRIQLHHRARKLEQILRRHEKRNRNCSATSRRCNSTRNNNENEIPFCSSQSRNPTHARFHNRSTQTQSTMSGLRGSSGNPFHRPFVSDLFLPGLPRRGSPNRKSLRRLARKVYSFKTPYYMIKDLKNQRLTESTTIRNR